MLKNILQVLENTENKYGSKTAFGDNKRNVTYSEFVKNSKSIGTYLIENCDSKKSSIVIFIDKTINCLETMMGIVYSGNFYTIIDTNSPKERVESILNTLKPEAVITDTKNLSKLQKIFQTDDIQTANNDKSQADTQNKNMSNNNQIRIINYDEIVATEVNQNLLDIVRDEQIDTDPMYVLFTSGSTGVPKGTVVSHRAVISYTTWVKDTFGINENTIWGSQTPFYFSMSITDVFTTMLTGATLYIIPKMYFSFPIKLLEFMDEKKVNTIYWVPSALCIVANLGALKDAKLPLMKKILFAGEVMPVKQLNMWMEKFSNCTFANLYGPTETTDICSYYVVDRKFKDDESIPIGKHCDNCNLLIVKENGTEVKLRKNNSEDNKNDNSKEIKDKDNNFEAVGYEESESGELLVRGSFLASGYYGNPEKTASAFVQNPLNSKYPELVYKTGDIVKYNKNGELIYLSRKDYQIKHMGYRIELGEIERNIYGIDKIVLCACIYDEKEQKIILFYQGDINENEVAQDAEKILLPYMRPNKYIKVNHMPYNSNGKIDRKKLKESVTK